MADEQRNTLDSNPLTFNNAQSACEYPISVPMTDNFGNTHTQMPVSNPTLVNNECSPLKKQADTLNLEFKKLIEDLDNKISSLPNGNFFLSQGSDSKIGEIPGSNISNSNDGTQPEFKGADISNFNHRFDDIHTIKDKINLNERAINVFERDVAKIQQNIGSQFDQVKITPNEAGHVPTTSQMHHPKYEPDQAYQRGRIHPMSTHNLGRALKDDDYIRSTRFREKQPYGINLQQNKIESSLSDSEAVGPPKMQFTQRKAIKELAQSWSRASSYSELKQTVIVKPCKPHICGKLGCRHHKDCALQQSAQSFSEMSSPVNHNVPNENVDNTTIPTNPMLPKEMLKAKLMKGKQKHIFGRRCVC